MDRSSSRATLRIALALLHLCLLVSSVVWVHILHLSTQSQYWTSVVLVAIHQIQPPHGGLFVITRLIRDKQYIPGRDRRLAPAVEYCEHVETSLGLLKRQAENDAYYWTPEDEDSVFVEIFVPCQQGASGRMWSREPQSVASTLLSAPFFNSQISSHFKLANIFYHRTAIVQEGQGLHFAC